MFEEHTNKSSISTIKPTIFGHESCAPSHHFGPAVRLHWLVHFVVSGFGIFQIDEQTYHLSPGEIFVIPPYVETYYQADEQHPWEYIWIGFTCDGELPCPLPHTLRCPDALSTFEQIRSTRHLGNGRIAFLTARVWDLFSLIMEREKPQTNYVKTALERIHSEYMYDLSVSNLAEGLGLDRSYCSTLFKDSTGVSPGQYLFNHRMSVAASLLSKGETGITMIANSVGYTDIYNFSRMFKRHFGVSPRAYVKANKNGSD